MQTLCLHRIFFYGSKIFTNISLYLKLIQLIGMIFTTFDHGTKMFVLHFFYDFISTNVYTKYQYSYVFNQNI